MKTLICSIRGTTRYSQSRFHGIPKNADESNEDHDIRTVKDHLHFDPQGMVYLPPSAFKNCLDEAAKFLSIKLKGQATYTKHFEAGTAIFEPVSLGIHKDDVQFEALYLHSNGQRGSGKRVIRHYPYIESGWKADVPFVILDDTVLHSYAGNPNETVFSHVLKAAGVYIGIGRWRPRNRGLYGRFAVERIVEAAEELPIAAE